MAKSTGIVLAAGGISFANDWIEKVAQPKANETPTPNLRIPVATLAVALVFAGIEQLNERAAVGLSWIMLITVLVTPIRGRAPVQNLALLAGGVNKGTKALPR
jgi:hypothetical protein